MALRIVQSPLLRQQTVPKLWILDMYSRRKLTIQELQRVNLIQLKEPQ